MPPKVKVTKEDIINAAIELVRKNGVSELNARSIAKELECSTQPIFSNFDNMQHLYSSVAQSAGKLCEEYIEREVKRNEFPVYKASGMAYIRFAREEKELFKLLYMSNHSENEMDSGSELNDKMVTIVKGNSTLNEDDAKLFHLEMWAFVHGIAAMFATDFLELEWNLVSKMLSDAYLGLKKQYGLEC